MESNPQKTKNLYFDIDKKNFIEFALNDLTTCETILTNYNDQIKNKITSIYMNTKLKNNSINKSLKSSTQVSISDFTFYIIETKIQTKKENNTKSLIRFKIKNDTLLSTYLENPCYNLYFLPMNKNSGKENLIKLKGKDKIRGMYEDIEKYNYNLIKNTKGDFLTKTAIYLYNTQKKNFTKEKGSVNEKKITIYSGQNENKILIEIFISEIIKINYFNDLNDNNININSAKYYYIKIYTKKQNFIFAEFKENIYLQWQNAINNAMELYKNFSTELNLDTEIIGEKINKFVTNHSIINNCFILNRIIANDEKRKMFLEDFPDKHISSIFNDIVMYKNLIKKNEFFNSWMKFKQILSYIDYYIDNNNKISDNNIICEEYNKIFNEDRIKIYKKIEEESYITFQKINQDPQILTDSFNTIVNNGLKNILDINLFNDLFYDLYTIYIVPYFEKEKKTMEEEIGSSNKPILRQKFQFLLALYCNQIFQMDTNNFNLFTINKNKNNIGENGNES